MTTGWKLYVSIFTKTFAELATAVALAAQGYSWLSGADLRTNFTTIGLGLGAAFIGAVIATGHAYAGSPATTPLSKAFRSAVQAFVGAAAAIVLNTTADLAKAQTVIVGSIAAVVLAFVITYLQNLPQLPEA